MAANDIIRYFDLQSAKRTTEAVGQGAGGSVSSPVLPQYVVLVLGIVVQPYLQHYLQTSQWSLTISDVIGRLAFGLIIGALANFLGALRGPFLCTTQHFVGHGRRLALNENLRDDDHR